MREVIFDPNDKCKVRVNPHYNSAGQVIRADITIGHAGTTQAVPLETLIAVGNLARLWLNQYGGE